MKAIAIIPNDENAAWIGNTKMLLKKLHALGCTVLIPKDLEAALFEEEATFVSQEALFTKSDLVITLGGDGTLLRAAKPAASHDVPILGVNIGRLGYLSELETGDVDEYLPRIIAGDFQIDARMLLEVSVTRQGQAQPIKRLALNEMFVSKQALGHTIQTEIYADGAYINAYFGDGVIIATPTGSTAYSLSCGGPVLDPVNHNIVITPISPHVLCARPIVMSDEREIRVYVNELYNKAAYVVCDGEQIAAVTGKDEVLVRRSENVLKLVRVKEQGFYDILREKLSERRERV